VQTPADRGRHAEASVTPYYLSITLSFVAAVAAQSIGVARAAPGQVRVPVPRSAMAGMAVISGLVLALVAALRWRVGTDYWAYEFAYPAYKSVDWAELDFLGEPGIRVIAKVSSHIHDDPTTMFAMAALITVGLTVRTIYRYSTMFALSMLLYVLTTTWQLSFNAVRQCLAAAILFAGHRYITDRRLGKWVLVVAVAMLFHVSALVLLFLYWLPRKQIGVGRSTLLLLVAWSAVLFYDYVASALSVIKAQDIQTSSYFIEDVNPLRIAAAFAPPILYAALTDRSKLRPEDFFYINALILNAVILLGAVGSAYIARFAIYTTFYTAIAIPRMLNMDDRREASFIAGIVVCCYAVFWFLETSTASTLSDFRWVFER
jgi:transmembrane protein EpsG